MFFDPKADTLIPVILYALSYETINILSFDNAIQSKKKYISGLCWHLTNIE